MPGQIIYPWKRFWLPFENASTISNDTYLRDPDSEYGHMLVPNAVTLDQLTDIPCLILRAEPGMGKTSEMKKAYQSLDQDGYKVEEFNLGESSEGGLNRFFDSDMLTEWRNGTHILHLFLDSLDEGLLTVPSLSERLIRELKKSKTHLPRLRLRIACRTSVFPEFLKSELARLFSVEESPTSPIPYDYFLAPLRVNDVRLAATTEQIDADRFLNEVGQVGVESFAVRPVTLRFLFSSFKSGGGTLPTSRKELYSDGCLELCVESNPSRQASNLTGKLSHQQRFNLAAQVAAVTLFCNRSKIWRHDSQVGISNREDYVFSSDFDETVEATHFGLRETLDTALFRGIGENVQTWSHQTYAEFLAAYFVKGFSFPQIRSLFIAQDGKVFPQLRETAAWVASFRKDFFEHLALNNPTVLLASDLLATGYSARESLVESFLRLFEDGEQSQDSKSKKFYRRLEHPNLAHQLAPYITSKARTPFTRDTAIQIAIECKTQSLQTQLVNLALDSSENLELRASSVVALWHIADDEAKQKLYPLIFCKKESDPDSELKGWVLITLWEGRLITPSELFSVLKEMPNDLVGSYRLFFSSHLIPHIQTEDLPVALHWISQLPNDEEISHRLGDVKSKILKMAFCCLDNPQILEAVVETLIHRSIRFDDEWPQFGDSEEGKRLQRHFIRTLFSSPLVSDENSYLWIGSIAYLVRQKNDFYWCVEQFEHATNEKELDTWAFLIVQSFNQSDHEQFEYLLRLSLIHPILHKRAHWFIDPVELDSDTAKYTREDHNRKLKRENKDTERTKFRQERQDRIAELLEKIETGKLAAWHWLVIELKCDDKDEYDDFSPDLTLRPAWRDISEKFQVRIQNAALRVLLEEKVPTNDWLQNTKTYPYICLNGICALFLLHQTSPETLQEFGSEFWSRWSASLLAYPISDEWENQKALFEIQQALLKEAFKHSPSAIIGAFSVRLRGLQNSDELSELEVKALFARVSSFWNDRWDEICWSCIQESPNLRRALLRELLKHSSHQTIQYADSLIPAYGNDPRILADLIEFKVPRAQRHALSLLREVGTDSDFGLLIMAARSLLRLENGHTFWGDVWAAMNQSERFGKEFFETAIMADKQLIPLMYLKDSELAELFVWMAKTYPIEEDQVPHGFFSSSPRIEITFFRMSPVNVLVERGTSEASEAISEIIQNLPSLVRLQEKLRQCIANRRRAEWQPPKPKDLFELARNNTKRFLQTQEDLFELVVESLKRLQIKLQDELNDAEHLWDRSSKPSDTPKGKPTIEFRPCEEERLSRYIARHLKEDLRGVVISREVEIRPGEFTDLHVDAIRVNEDGTPPEVLTVIVEAKGCWNQHLKTDMETQLVNRYLRGNHCRFGLYLVGWFFCPAWCEEDSRFTRARGHAREKIELQRLLDEQAHGLSKDGLTVRSFILDCTLRESPAQKSARPATKLVPATKVAVVAPHLPKAPSKRVTKQKALPAKGIPGNAEE